MSTTMLPVVDGPPPAGEAADWKDRREAVIRAGVLAALGRPPRLYRVAVVPLWGDHYRVNVMIGDDPTAIRIPHSYFLVADQRGNVIKSTPGIQNSY
jgi:hypothetical protein